MKFGEVTKVGDKTIYHAGNYDSYSEMISTLFSKVEDKQSYRLIKGSPKLFVVGNSYKDRLMQIENEVDIALLTKRFLKFRENRSVLMKTEPVAKYDVHGDFCDFGRFTSGDPECMVNYYGDDSLTGKFYDIELEMDLPMWVHQKAKGEKIAFEYYCGILDIIDNLERNGNRCQIKGTITANDNRTASLDKNDFLKMSFIFKKHQDIFNFEAFVKIFLTKISGYVSLIATVLLGRMESKFGYQGSYWIALDSKYPEICRYDKSDPYLIKYPSLWRPFNVNFRKETAADILNELGYDII